MSPFEKMVKNESNISLYLKGNAYICWEGGAGRNVLGVFFQKKEYVPWSAILFILSRHFPSVFTEKYTQEVAKVISFLKNGRKLFSLKLFQNIFCISRVQGL